MTKLDMTKLATAANKNTSTDSSDWLIKRMSWFNEDSAVRKTKVRSVQVSLNDLREFAGNPRVGYTGEEQEALQESIEKNGVTEEIGVVLIKNTGDYIVCDGHRRKRAIAAVKGANAQTEVIIRKEFDTYSSEVELFLFRTAISTSSLKKKLSVYEQIRAIKAYIAHYEKAYPEKGPVTISQKEIYESLGYAKTYAMQLSKLILQFSDDELEAFNDDQVAASFIRSIAPYMEGFEKHPELRKAIIDRIQSGDITSRTGKEVIAAIKKEISSPESSEGMIKQIKENLDDGLIEDKEDLRTTIEARMDVEHTITEAAIPDPIEREKAITEITKKRAKKEKEQKTAKNPQDLYHRDVRKGSQQLTKALLGLRLEELSDTDRAEVINQLIRTKQGIDQFLNTQAPESLTIQSSL
jgi:hypothetical protein